MFARDRIWRALAACVLAAGLMTGGSAHAVDPPVRIGLDADMTADSALSGEAIRRGAALAVVELNQAGGILGRPVEMLVLDHRGVPSRGLDNIEIMATMTGLVAVLGGVHTPVALHELPALHENRIIYLDVWASGTPIIENGYDPNYAFRVAISDSLAGDFLVTSALERGYRRPALLLMETGWGRSNEKAMTAALAERDMKPAAVEWFRWGTKSLAPQIERIARSGADVILMVAGIREGPVAVRDMAARPEYARLPIISHSGITSGDFFAATKDSLGKVDLSFLQSYSFVDPPHPGRAKRFLANFSKLYPEGAVPEKIAAPPAVAHAYDAVNLLARAIEKAGTLDRPAVRDALEHLGPYEGLVRDYDPPFTPQRHDALTDADYFLARFDADGTIVPDRQ